MGNTSTNSAVRTNVGASQNRVIFYYQTFVGLREILYITPAVTHIHLSAIHFGLDSQGKPYIHLNDNDPGDGLFDSVYAELRQADSLGISIKLMIGGAGLAYQMLFSNYPVYFDLLLSFLYKCPFITGVDLDIEEPAELEDIRKLIRDIKSVFPQYTIAMAPLQEYMETDTPCLGPASYKDLYMTEEGKLIDYFCVQCYNDFSKTAYEQIIDNGYPASKVVMGCLDGGADPKVIGSITQSYKDFGGVHSWEFSTTTNPGEWARVMAQAMNTK